MKKMAIHGPQIRRLRGCLKIARGAAARDFGCGQRRRGRSIPVVGCNGRANAAHSQKTRRREGLRANSIPRNFQTGS